MMATSQNQIVPITLSSIRRQDNRIFAAWTMARIRSKFDFAINQEQPQNPQNRVHPHEANQREPRIARADARRDAARSAHQSVDQPGLPPEFGGHPSGGVRNVGKRNAEHQQPVYPARVIQFSSPEQQRSQNHHYDEDRSKPDHYVITVIEKRN